MKRKVFSVVCLALVLVLTVCLAACNPNKHATFKVTAEYDSAQGSVVISNSDGIEKANFKPGEQVTVKVTANSEYMVDSFKVNDEDAELTDGVYSFNVSKDTIVKVIFRNKEIKEVIPLPTDALNSVKTTFKASGVYVYHLDGANPDISSVTTIFGTNSVNLIETGTDGEIIYDDVYVNVDGKLAMPSHTLDNKIEYIFPAGGELFAEYANPFILLTANDFALTDEDHVYELLNADKRKSAATAITGYVESIASFKVTVDGDKVAGIDIQTERIKSGSDYYTAIYSLEVSDWGEAEVDANKFSVYEKKDEHTALANALAAAFRASNYTIKINEFALSSLDDDLEYNIYVTESAIYNDCDVVNSEGKYIWKEGYVEIGETSTTVYPFNYDPDTGIVTLHDPNKNFKTVRSMRASFNSLNDFAPEIFEFTVNEDGTVTYTLHAEVDTVENVRDILFLNFADGLDMISLYLYYSYTLSITLKEGALYQVSLLYAVSDALIYRTMTYFDFDDTEMPITFDNCERDSVLDDFIGTYTDGYIVAVIDENGIIINGQEFEVENYDVWYGMFTGYWNGGVWGLARVNDKQLILVSDEDDTSYVLTSTVIEPVSIPKKLEGVWNKEGNDNVLAIAYNYVELNGVMLKVLSYSEDDGLYAMGGGYTYNFYPSELNGSPVIAVTTFFEGLPTGSSYVLHKDANAVLIPEQFVGTWEKDDYQYGYHKAIVGLTAVSLNIKGQKPTVTVVSVAKEGNTWKITLNADGFVVGNDDDDTVDGLEFVIQPYYGGDDRIYLNCTDYLWGTNYSVTLEKGDDNNIQPSVPERFYGTYYGSDDNDIEYVISIGENGVVVTIDGVNYNAIVTEFDSEYDLITLNINGKLYYIMPNIDDETAIDFMDNDATIEVTLELVGGDVDIPSKYCGTFTASKDGVDYVITISNDGVTISVDGEDKLITSIKYINEYEEEYITVKFDGVVYTISDASYANPITRIMFYSSDYSVVITLNRQA